MKGIRQAVTCLCLAMTLFVAVPSLVVSGEACPSAEPASAPIVHSVAKLDLSQLRTQPTWSPQAMASSQSPDPEKVQTQTSTKKWSTAKKTWVIVGSVVGAEGMVPLDTLAEVD